MSDFDWPSVRALFDAVVELPEAERSTYLERVGIGAEIRAEVERMLRSDRAAPGFLESSTPFLEQALRPRLGTHLGRYELKRVIASGGMGTVFEAVQDEPRRAVALKTLRLGGFASPERLQRFRFEAEVLGQLRHPSIAQVFEANTHEEAGEVVPFIAMELVPGARDLLSYARGEELSLPARLALFLAVCEAVQHGHQKGVIHRDLKPGNILVDTEGRAKVIDFGVARATARASSLGGFATQTGQILGTLAYMAPEQLAGSPEAIDVRSDVYALGVVLFELLEGRPPHEFADKSPVQALRAIQDEPPRPLPSTPRELGWIVMKALAKEPERRYGSIAELAEDLRRYLRHEPVLAGPPGVAYRLSKWIQRNPAKTAAAAIGVVAFVAITWLLVQNMRSNRALSAERTNLANANIALQAKTTEAEASAAQALENARVAMANERQATEEKERADREAEAATKKADEVLRLSALQKLDDLVAEADRLWPPFPENLRRYEEWLRKADALMAELPDHERKLTELRAKSVPWTQDKWWHNQLEKLVDGLKSFADEKTGLHSEGTSPQHGWGIPRRAEFARTIAERSVRGDEAAALWAEAVAAIANPEECLPYGGLRITPQLGLLPIGRDPGSGLWEFAHLQTGDPAQRGPDGRLTLKEETGLVFVLLPGGTFQMGAQSLDPNGDNYDAQAAESEGPVHDVTLSPFFLSKYEMTQGQWSRFVGSNPSSYPAGSQSARTRITLLHPVELVSWDMCELELDRLGLSLPSEAQWEYACRAGTSTPWSPGDSLENLRGHANIADEGSADAYTKGWLFEPGFSDGWDVHCPVGSLRPNAFGLFEMHGNVWEWCQDGARPYQRGLQTDPVDDLSDYAFRVNRGGGYDSRAGQARSAYRIGDAPAATVLGVGLRPARPLMPP